jgi:plastocyanin
MRLLSALLLLPLAASAQTLWPVNVGGSTIGSTPPYYSPQNLTINVGDQVRWTNVSGTHNVNGNQSLFPGNPQSFGSGSPQSGGWTYTFTFTIPGVYSYHCTQVGHAATQFGSITVVDPGTGLAEVAEAGNELRVFPSPASDRVFVDLGASTARELRIINLNGEVVGAMVGSRTGIVTLDVSSLSPASYFVLVTDGEGRMRSTPFIKQ